MPQYALWRFLSCGAETLDGLFVTVLGPCAEAVRVTEAFALIGVEGGMDASEVAVGEGHAQAGTECGLTGERAQLRGERGGRW